MAIIKFDYGNDAIIEYRIKDKLAEKIQKIVVESMDLMEKLFS